FENISNHFYSTQHVNFVFENKENIVLDTDENFLLTIMRNLTGNAAKALLHTTDATIVWKAILQDGKPVLSITDNGPGIETGELKALYYEKEITGIKSGLGLHLIRDMAKAIDCTIDIKSEKDKGSIFTLYFKA
ncbi:MAG: HAMP domain-containing histidine kinase, partial [Chitinophagaceae bacterium]